METRLNKGRRSMKINCSYDELVEVHKLVENPKNPNKHPDEQIERLAKIIDYQGQRSPVIVSKRSGFIVVGHGRLAAMKKLGAEKVAVNYQDFIDEAQEYAHVTADNAIAEWASLDLSEINKEMLDLGPDLDIDLLGLKDFVIEPIEKFEAQTDEDAVPEVEDPITKRGDIWLLGNHRVMCGDSTNPEHLEILTQGSNVDLIHTDPPYGMSAVSKSGVLSKNYSSDIIGDSDTSAAKDSFTLAQELFPNSKQIWWGANYYSSVLPDSECWLVWDKNNGQSDQTDCELAWANFRSVVRQFTQSSEKRNRVHPTQKPVSLMEWIIKRFKYSGSNVLDLFLGSGSTLIAAEKNNIKCYGMELDEKYCDVIVNRWQNYTGKEAILESNNKTYNELKDASRKTQNRVRLE